MVSRQRNGRRPGLAAVTLGLWLVTGRAHADTLVEALVEAYQSNPVLQGQRYDLKALDETYVRAFAAVRPKGELQITGDYADTRAGNDTQALRLAADPTVGRRLVSNKDDVRIVLEQLLYSGGQSRSAIAASAYQVRAGREALRIAEGDLLLQVVAAYEDVRRDSQGLEVRQQDIQTLQRQLDMTQARQTAGEVTRTDVEQARAQLQGAQAQLTLAQAQLQNSRANYAALVGRMPAGLEAPPDLPLLPANIDDAFRLAEAGSPEINQARFNERESAKRIQQARAAGHTTVVGQTSYGINGKLAPFDRRAQDADFTVSLTVTKPLFSGGQYASDYREALARNGSDRERIEAVRRTVMQNVLNAWNQMAAARINVQVQTQQLKSAEIAARGMREEFRFGQRSTLDVLVAEQALRDAQLALIASKHDAYVAQAAMLRQIGFLEARVLVVNLGAYDPTRNLRDLKQRTGVPWEGAILGLDGLGRNAPPMPPALQMPKSSAGARMIEAAPGTPEMKIQNRLPAR